MLNIAIVEDSKDALENLKNHIARLQKEKGIECEYTLFENGLFFIEKYEPVYDVVFMDIDMPLMNGMEAARHLREVDQHVSLVFITDLKQYALKGYEVEAMDFLVKPVLYSAFSTMMERVCRRATKKEAQIAISTPEGTYNVNINDIYYIGTDSHYITYYTTSGDYTFFGTISEEEQKLPSDTFIRCNSGIIVNLARVQKVQGSDVYIANKCLPISRNKKGTFMQNLLDYMSKKK